MEAGASGQQGRLSRRPDTAGQGARGRPWDEEWGWGEKARGGGCKWKEKATVPPAAPSLPSPDPSPATPPPPPLPP
eukprot:5648616-Pyramimonas_sp.AAC.1